MNWALLSYFVIFIVICVTFTKEVIAPASKNSCDRRWLIMASVIAFIQFCAAVGSGLIFESFFENYRIFNASDLNVIYQGLLGFLVTSFIAYWWHRAMHKNDFLWRVFHQLHHSPKRIETLSAFYLHPFDSMAATFLNALSGYYILGLGPYGVVLSLFLAAIYNVFIHCYLRTRRWIGFVLENPEMHRVHHKTGHHAQNYGISIWDALFGTFNNPTQYVDEVGFDQARSERVFDMLILQDVYKKKKPKK